MADVLWTRRMVVGAGLGAITVPWLLPDIAVAEDLYPTFALDPAGTTTCKTSCSTCTACVKHAANKIFRTELAATSHRAHLGCNCTVVPGQELSATVYKRLFEETGATDVTDRRYALARELLGAGTNTHAVPMLDGVGPAAVLLGGAAGVVLWTARRRGVVAGD